MALCNAPLAHTTGFCINVAGENTEHLGTGVCSFHGGDTSNQDSVDDLLRRVGLVDLIKKSNALSPNDIEQLYHTSNTGLTLVRAQLVARLSEPDNSPKEMTDLTGSIQKIDNILKAYKRESKGAKAEASKREADSVEHDRLDNLETELFG